MHDHISKGAHESVVYCIVPAASTFQPLVIQPGARTGSIVYLRGTRGCLPWRNPESAGWFLRCNILFLYCVLQVICYISPGVSFHMLFRWSPVCAVKWTVSLVWIHSKIYMKLMTNDLEIITLHPHLFEKSVWSLLLHFGCGDPFKLCLIT